VVEASTLRQYVSVRRRLVDALGPRPLASIRPRDVADYIAPQSVDLGAATVGRDVSVLHALFVSAKREELVETNPAEGAERPKVPRPRWRILEADEVARVSRAFTDAQARVVFLTLVLLGLWRSELQALRWGSVDLLEGVVRVVDSKTETGERSIAIPPGLGDELTAHYRRIGVQGRHGPRLLSSGTWHDLPRRELQRGADGRADDRRRRGEAPGLPRPAALSDHARRRVWFFGDRGDDESRALEHAHDADVPAPCRCRVPR
jgi:integrase